jgi:catechol 2,3-dioxygenase-like lactoylglutathione lyase family enzyme
LFKFDRFKVFLYYKNLETAKHFYRDLLGLPEYKESEHVWQYWASPDTAIGIVEDGHGYLPATKDKPVMPCLHLAPDQDIEGLFNYLKENGVKMLDEGVRKSSLFGDVFLVEDPGGYVIEFVKRPQ